MKNEIIFDRTSSAAVRLGLRDLLRLPVLPSAPSSRSVCSLFSGRKLGLLALLRLPGAGKALRGARKAVSPAVSWVMSMVFRTFDFRKPERSCQMVFQDSRS